LLVLFVLVYLSGRTPKVARVPAGHAGLALWSFIMSTAHGAGLMLVPALIPLCMGDASAREITASGSLTLALAAVGVHTAAMLAVTGVIATGVCRGFDAGARLLRGGKREPPPAPR
jgi:NhaP-type Na+/H+ or K+/H+ antiporter